MLRVAYQYARSWTSRTVSYPNVLYVVSAPQNPVPTARTTGCGAPAPSSAPSTADPATFTAKVPHGNSESCHDEIHWSTTYRSGAPTAAPSATSSRLTAARSEEHTS